MGISLISNTQDIISQTRAPKLTQGLSPMPWRSTLQVPDQQGMLESN